MTRGGWITLAVAYAALLLIALGWRLAVYDRYLPLLDYSDESNMYLASVDMRGPDEFPLADDYGAYLTGDWLAGYPPLYLWLGVWVQRAQDATASAFLFPGAYIHAMRLISVGANALTVAGLLWLGWSAARPVLGAVAAGFAGWFTALPYALSPQVIDIGSLAIPDSLIPLACVAALLGAVRAVTRDAAGWLVVSLLGAIAAIYLKYSLLFALWPVFCSTLVLMYRRGWRALLPWLAALALISALTAGWLVWGYGGLNLQNREADNFRENGLTWMFDVDRNRSNLWVALDVVMGLWPFVAVIVAGVAAYALARRDGLPTVPLGGVWVLLPYVLGNMLLTSSVVYATLQRGGYGRVRYMFPAALALSLIWGLALAQVGVWLPWRGGAARLATGGLVVAITLLIAVPDTLETAALAREYALPDTNLLLWQYADASLPADGKILMARDSRTHLVWNRPYSGYTGTTAFDWVHDDNPQAGTPHSAYEAGISYFVVTERDRRRIYADAQDYIADLWPLKTIRARAGEAVGETTSVYRMMPPQVNANAAFGEAIRLIGYDLSADVVAPGDTLGLRPYWHASHTPAANYSMFVHLYPMSDPTAIVAQVDGPPVSAARLPLTWTDPDEQLIGADVTLMVPGDVPPGEYVLAVGLYNFETGTRLPVGGSDRYEIPITIN